MPILSKTPTQEVLEALNGARSALDSARTRLLVAGASPDGGHITRRIRAIDAAIARVHEEWGSAAAYAPVPPRVLEGLGVILDLAYPATKAILEEDLERAEDVPEISDLSRKLTLAKASVIWVQTEQTRHDLAKGVKSSKQRSGVVDGEKKKGEAA